MEVRVHWTKIFLQVSLGQSHRHCRCQFHLHFHGYYIILLYCQCFCSFWVPLGLLLAFSCAILLFYFLSALISCDCCSYAIFFLILFSHSSQSHFVLLADTRTVYCYSVLRYAIQLRYNVCIFVSQLLSVLLFLQSLIILVCQ